MILGLRTFIVYVHEENLNDAKEWYTRFAGVKPYFDQPFYVGFNVGGFELGLHPDGESGPGGTVAYWGTPDINAELNRVTAFGATVVDPVENVGDGILVATIADPFGNQIGLIQNPHFDVKAVK